MKTIDFKTSEYFSGAVILAGIILFITGLAIINLALLGGILLCLASLVMMTTHYRLTIDYEKRKYHDYVWFLGLKNGESGKFERIEYLFIKKAKVSQSLGLRAANSTIRKEVYDGYLKFSDDVKIHLITRDDKSNLIKKMKMIADKLNVKIIDHTGEEAIIV